MKIVRKSNNISISLSKKQKQLSKVAKQAYKFFKKETPIRSGNARRNTFLRSTSRKDTIEAKYDYAKRLDDGYSKQSPDGMSEPTQDFIQSTIGKIL